MKKGKDSDPDLWLTDPDLWLTDPDPGGLKTCGSGRPKNMRIRIRIPNTDKHIIEPIVLEPERILQYKFPRGPFWINSSVSLQKKIKYDR